MRSQPSVSWPVLMLATACASSAGTTEDGTGTSVDDSVTGPDDGPGASLDSGDSGDSGTTTLGDPVQLFVNELMPANSGAVLVDDTSPDWIELYNPGADPVPLGGFTITDDLESPDKAPLTDDLVVPANGHLVLWASGSEEGGAHLPFKLSSDGEAVGLYFPSGEPADQVTYGPTLDNFALARQVDGDPTWTTTAQATPGAPNEVD